MNWSEFFHMGGYAFYVWSSYILFLIVVIANIVAPIIQRKTVIGRVRRAIKRDQVQQSQ